MAETLSYTLERAPGAPGRIELLLGSDGAVDLRYEEPSSGPPAAHRFRGVITDAPFIAWLRAFPPSDPATHAWPLEPPLPCSLAYVQGGKRHELGRDFKLTRDSRTSGTFSFLHRVISTASGGMLSLDQGAAPYAFKIIEESAPELPSTRADALSELEIIGVIRLLWDPRGARAQLAGSAEPFSLSAEETQTLRAALSGAGFPAFLPRGSLPSPEAPGLVRGVWGDQAFAFFRSPEERRALRRWGPALRALEDIAAARIRSPGSATTPPDPGAQAEAIVYRTSAISLDAFRQSFWRSSPGALSVTLDKTGRISIEYADPPRGARYRWRARWSSPALASLLPFELRPSGGPRRSVTPPAWIDVIWRGALYDIGFHGLALPAALLEQLDALVRHITADTLRVDVGHARGSHRVNAAEVELIEEAVDLDHPALGEPLAPFDEIHYKDPGSAFHGAPALTISLTRSHITRNGASTPLSAELLARFDALVAQTRLPLFEPYADRIMVPDSTFISLDVRRGERRADLSLEYNRAHAHPRLGALFTAMRQLGGQRAT